MFTLSRQFLPLSQRIGELFLPCPSSGLPRQRCLGRRRVRFNFSRGRFTRKQQCPVTELVVAAAVTAVISATAFGTDFPGEHLGIGRAEASAVDIVIVNYFPAGAD